MSKTKLYLINKNKGGGKRAWYLRQSGWIDGKHKIVWEKYLGSAERIFEMIQKSSSESIKLKSFAFGKNAALLKMNEELNFIDIVNKYTRKKKIEGFTVGEYLFLIIAGRCNGPISKSKTGQFFKNSFYNFLFEPAYKLNCQNFINNMKYLDHEAINAIEDEIGKVLIEKGLSPNRIFWDTTNNFTHIENGEKLPRKGNSKQKRYDKNIIGVGIAVSEENIPFLHETFSGNENDAMLFPKIFEKLIKRFKTLNLNPKDIILVVDKGNNSKNAMVDVLKRMKVIGSFKYNQFEKCIDIPIDIFEKLYENERKHIITGYRMYGRLFDNEVTVVITYNKHTMIKQKQTYTKYEEKFLKFGYEVSKKINKQRAGKKNGKKPTKSGIIREFEKRIPKQYRSILKYDVVCDKDEIIKVDYWIDEDNKKKMEKTLGKQFLFTNCNDLQTAQVAKIYNEKYLLENDFKWIKNKMLVPITPYFLRKDDIIRVHDFLCVVGLLFYRYLIWKTKHFGITVDELLNALENIRVAVITNKGSLKPRFVIEEMNSLQARLFSFLGLEKYIP